MCRPRARWGAAVGEPPGAAGRAPPVAAAAWTVSRPAPSGTGPARTATRSATAGASRPVSSRPTRPRTEEGPPAPRHSLARGGTLQGAGGAPDRGPVPAGERPGTLDEGAGPSGVRAAVGR